MKKILDFYLNSVWLPLAIFLILSFGMIRIPVFNAYLYIIIYFLSAFGILKAGICQIKNKKGWKGSINILFFIVVFLVGTILARLYVDAFFRGSGRIAQKNEEVYSGIRTLQKKVKVGQSIDEVMKVILEYETASPSPSKNMHSSYIIRMGDETEKCLDKSSYEKCVKNEAPSFCYNKFWSPFCLEEWYKQDEFIKIVKSVANKETIPKHFDAIINISESRFPVNSRFQIHIDNNGVVGYVAPVEDILF